MKRFWVSLGVALALLASQQIVISGVYGLTPAQFELVFAGGSGATVPQNLPSVIAESGTPVTIYGDGASHVVSTVSLPANSIPPDSTLELTLLMSKYNPLFGGSVVLVAIDGTTIGQSFPVATNLGLNTVLGWNISSDLSAGKSVTNGLTQNNVSAYTANFNDVLSPTQGQAAYPYGVHVNSPVKYKIDFTVAHNFTISLQPAPHDVLEISGWTLVSYKNSASPTKTLAPANSVAYWGDSLTYGVGAGTTVSATTGPYPQQIAYAARVGIPFTNQGVGGDKSSDIAARVIADKMRGKYWNAVFDMGRNDFDQIGSAAVLANIAKSVANLAPGVNYVVNTVANAANEPPGSGNWNGLVLLNNSIKSTYGAHVADVFNALTAGGTTQVNNNLRNITVSTTSNGSTASGATSITVTSPTSIVNGMFVDDATGFIPAQTTITISGSVITLSAATTGIIPTGTTLNFVAASEVHFRDAGYAIKASTVVTAMTANGF